jgi:catechol 2,3-dioxygenase-like lactoylglutathione lyase family enzyme
MSAKLVPELVVTDIARSLQFYVGKIGFAILYDRPEFGFAYLDLEGASLMIEEFREGPRDWRTGPLEAPLGRGINFQIEVRDVDAIHNRLIAEGWPMFWPMEERWYRKGEANEVGNRQFLTQDPDGYLLRFFSDLGQRPLGSA